MKEATNKEIGIILDEFYAKSLNGNVKTILFVHELDDEVKEKISKWVNNKISIKNNKIFWKNYEVGYGKDIDYKISIHNNFKKNKETYQLVIISVLYPLWNNKMPLFDEKDYDMFDEVILLKLNKNDFKDYFKNKIELIRSFALNTKDEDYLSELSLQEEIGMYILNHPQFDFIPIEETEGTNVITGNNTNHFSPVDFNKLIFNRFLDIFGIDKFIDYIRNPNFTPKAVKMLVTILNDYKDKSNNLDTKKSNG